MEVALMAELLPIILALTILVSGVAGAAILTWFERRLLGVWQDRYGPNRLGPLGIGQVLGISRASLHPDLMLDPPPWRRSGRRSPLPPKCVAACPAADPHQPQV